MKIIALTLIALVLTGCANHSPKPCDFSDMSTSFSAFYDDDCGDAKPINHWF